MYRLRYIKTNVALIITLFCTACALFNPQYALPIQNNFDISGRFVVITDKDRQYGNFVWLRMNNNELIELTTPLGQTIARIMINDHEKSITTQDQTYTGSLHEILREHFNLNLPVEYLHYWLLGHPIPHEQSIRNDNGFKQLGWQVKYISWGNTSRILECSNNTTTVKILIN